MIEVRVNNTEFQTLMLKMKIKLLVVIHEDLGQIPSIENLAKAADPFTWVSVQSQLSFVYDSYRFYTYGPLLEFPVSEILSEEDDGWAFSELEHDQKQRDAFFQSHPEKEDEFLELLKKREELTKLRKARIDKWGVKQQEFIRLVKDSQKIMNVLLVQAQDADYSNRIEILGTVAVDKI